VLDVKYFTFVKTVGVVKEEVEEDGTKGVVITILFVAPDTVITALGGQNT
jgi:hypothetical protein